MQVPAFDITRQNKYLEPLLTGAFQHALQHGHFILGDEVKEFEAKIATYLGTRYAIAVANGSDALALGLLALGIQPGDEVIVPGFTFFATAGSVSRIGATPVFVDVLAADYNIDMERLREKITSKTKAIIPVHLFGMPVKMDQLTKIAREYNLQIIEDAAQALGTIFQGKRIGTIGDIGCFSLFPTKNLGCFGDGGLVTTNQVQLAEKLQMLRVHGTRKKYYHEILGFNSRLDTIQAGFLNIKLPWLDGWLIQRRRIVAIYRKELAPIAEIELPAEAEGHSYNQFTIRTKKRDQLRQYLTQHGIGTNIYYPLALHLQPVFHSLGYQEGALPVSEALTREVLSLPLFPELTPDEQTYVITEIKNFFKVALQ